MSSHIFEASQVDVSLHSLELLELLKTKVSRTLIDYVVDCVYETVDYALGRPSSSRGRSHSRTAERANFAKFVTHVFERASVKTPVILVSLVYIDRAKSELEIALEQWACERVFLGALILANKFLNDSTLKNVHWARCTGVFRTRDIGRIEREFLEVLAFDLNITEADVLSHHAPVMALLHPIPHIARSSSLFERVAKHLTWSAGESTLGDSPNPSSASSSSVETSASPNTPEDPRTSLAESQNPQSTISAEATEELPLQLTPPPAYSHHDPNSQSATKTTSQKSHHHHHHHQHHHHRFSTALQMLRSIPISIPNFHTSPVSTSPSSSSSSSSSSSLSDAESESGVSPRPPSVSIPASRKSASYRSASPHAADHSSSSVRVSILPTLNERCRPALFQRVSSHLIVGQV